MSQPKRGRSSQAQNHLITILLALVIAGLSMWFGAGRDGGNGPDAAATPVPGSGLTVTYLDVGQGDCTLLQCDGQTMLIDAGIGEQANHITTYLKQQGVKSIDYLVCTHAHADHCGGMKAVIAAFPVHTFYSSVTSSSNGAFQRVMRAAETANLAITVPGVGDTFALGGATVTVLGPQKHYSDVNDQSLILRVDYGSNAFLFTGDASSSVIGKACGHHVDVLKVGHHGSRTSTTQQLAETLSPDWAVISVGAGNSYGHPSEEVLSALSGVAHLLRTDLDGTVTLSCDGETIRRAA